MAEKPISDVLRRIPYGFYSITSKSGKTVNAMVANWLTQASFDPQLLALALQKTSFTYEMVNEGKAFAVNLFKKGDEEVLKRLTKGRKKNPEKMEGVSYTSAPETGCPILEGAAAFLECKVVDIFSTGGDHDIVLGEVIGAGVIKDGEVEETLTLPDIGWNYSG